MGGRGRGRPKGSRKVSKAQGKSIAKCAVCSLTRRADKVKEHQVSSVLFDINGEPAGEDHPCYENLSEDKKKHTDFFRVNKYNRLNLPPNKIIVPESPGSITSFFMKKPRLDVNNDNNEYLLQASSSESDDEELVDNRVYEDTNNDFEGSEKEEEGSLSDLVAGSETVFNDVTDQDSNLDEAGGDYQSERGIDMGQQAGISNVSGDKLIADLSKSIISQFGNEVEIKSLGNVSKVIAARVVEKLEEVKRRNTVLE